MVQTLHLGSKLLFSPFFSFPVSFWHSSFPRGDVGAAVAPRGEDSPNGSLGRQQLPARVRALAGEAHGKTRGCSGLSGEKRATKRAASAFQG